MMQSLRALVALLGMLGVNSLYFLVKEARSCFTIEQPKDTPMVFSYVQIDPGNEIGFDLYYGSLAQPDQQIMHKVWSEKSGHVDFVADNDGAYSYCLQLPPMPKMPVVRLQLVLNYGFDSEYYEALAKKFDYDAVNLKVHELNDMLTLTLNEADYQKHKEVEYHDVTEKMNSAALWWPVIQIGILIATGIYQVQHLKSFFKANKLI